MPEDKKSAVEDFLGLEKQSEDPFKEEVPASEEVLEEEIVEKPIPFHKDPKVQRFIEKEISKRMGGMQASTPTITSSLPTATPDVEDVVGAFRTIIGDDTPEKVRALKALEKSLQTSDDRAAQKAVERLQAEQEKQTQAQIENDQKAQDELDTSFDEIEETYGVDLSSNTAVAKKTRSEFVEYIRKIAPKNEMGEVDSFPDMVSAFEEFQERSKRTAPVPSRSKELASRGMSRSTDATVAPVNTDKSWKGVEKFLSKLSN